jgi:hypothetical protein
MLSWLSPSLVLKGTQTDSKLFHLLQITIDTKLHQDYGGKIMMMLWLTGYWISENDTLANYSCYCGFDCVKVDGNSSWL